MSAERPTPSSPPAEGHHWEVSDHEPYLRWRLVTDDEIERVCRGGGRGCKGQVVAMLNRGRPGTTRRFYYCADHLYGRWIEDEKVLHWRLVPDAGEGGNR